MILCQTTPAQLNATAEAIRAQVQALGIENPGATHGIVTISGGSAVVIPAPGRSMHVLIQRADEALYVAKSAGRNCMRANEQDLPNVATGRFRRRALLRAVS